MTDIREAEVAKPAAGRFDILALGYILWVPRGQTQNYIGFFFIDFEAHNKSKTIKCRGARVLILKF